MNNLPTVHMAQFRGAWIAKCKDSYSQKIIGHSRIPILRDFQDGQWTWDGVGKLHSTPDQTEYGPWWLYPRQKMWREMLLETLPIGVRHATQPSDSSPTGSVGKWIGVYLASDVIIARDFFTVVLTQKIAEVG